MRFLQDFLYPAAPGQLSCWNPQINTPPGTLKEMFADFRALETPSFLRHRPTNQIHVPEGSFINPDQPRTEQPNPYV